MNKVCLALILTTGLLTGCQSVIDAGKPKPDDPSFAPALPEEHPTLRYQGAQGGRSDNSYS